MCHNSVMCHHAVKCHIPMHIVCYMCCTQRRLCAALNAPSMHRYLAQCPQPTYSACAQPANSACAQPTSTQSYLCTHMFTNSSHNHTTMPPSYTHAHTINHFACIADTNANANAHQGIHCRHPYQC